MKKHKNKRNNRKAYSDAGGVIEHGKNIEKDAVAKIICADENFLGRTIKCLFKEYEGLTDEKAGDLICDIEVQSSNETGTLKDLYTSKKYSDVTFSIKDRPVNIRIFMEPNFYHLSIKQLINRSLQYGCDLFSQEREPHKSNYDLGADIYGVWIIRDDRYAGTSIIWGGGLSDIEGNIRSDIEVNSHIQFHFCFIENEYDKIDKKKEPLVSFYSTVFSKLKDKNDKIELLKDEQHFDFRQKAREEMIVNGLAEFYREVDSKEINRLKDEVKTKEEALVAKEEALAAKDEQIKADNIATLKGMMQELNLDFDRAFAIARYDVSLKEEYRKLIEEKN